MVKASSSTLHHLPPSALSGHYLIPTYVGRDRDQWELPGAAIRQLPLGLQWLFC